MTERASARAMDFTNVKDGGGRFTKARQAEGDHKGRITAVEDVEAKTDKTPMWLYTIEVNGETYPWYCKLVENQLWKVRALFAAAGTVIPKKRMKVDPNKIVGKFIGVTLEDDEYNSRLQSNIRGVIPVDQIQGDADDGDIDDTDDDEEEEAPPARPTRRGKAAPEPEPEDEEEEEEETPPPAPRRKSKAAPEPEEDEEEDAEEEEEEAPPPPRRRAAKKTAPAAKGKSRVVDDEDLEDLDLEGL